MDLPAQGRACEVARVCACTPREGGRRSCQRWPHASSWIWWGEGAPDRLRLAPVARAFWQVVTPALGLAGQEQEEVRDSPWSPWRRKHLCPHPVLQHVE